MFYTVDLLSHRRRGKLAACWLAATTSEKLFKRYYNSIAIKKINIIRTCEEILKAIQLRNIKTQRFSLYLSSQLMCGVTKIHFYQITYYQKDVLEIWQELDFTMLSKKKGEDFDAVRALDTLPTIELPSLNQYLFHSAHLDEDLHILPGEKPDGRLQVIMQDATCLNFGALTDEELDFMLNHNGDIMLDSNEKMQIDDNTKKDVTGMMADIEISEEVHRERNSPRVILSPVLMNVSRDIIKSKLPVTPQKRQTHQPYVETPTKRRRLSFEDATIIVPPVPSEDVIIPELSVEKTFPPLSVEQKKALPLQQAELDMELDSLHSSFFIIKKHPKKGKIIDKKIILEDKLFRQWHQNEKICCTQLTIPQIHHLTPAMQLFNQPSHWPKQWCNKLYDLFVDPISRPFIIPNSDALTEIQEAIRLGETTSKLDFPTEEWSTLGKHITTTGADGFALESISNIPPMIERTDIIHEIREALTVPLAEMDMDILEQDIGVERVNDQKKIDVSDLDETLLDVESMLERRWYHSRTRDRISKSSTPVSQTTYLTSQEILALLEILWCNRQCVKLSELISRDTYAEADIATVFYILLELHAKKKVILQQTACYHTLWIRKYENYID